MMDINQILLFIAIASPMVVLVRLRRGPEQKRGWRIVSLMVLMATLGCWLISPSVAGYVGGGVWFGFLFLPAVGLRRAADLAAQERYSAARSFIHVSQFLHPADGVPEQAELLRALELAQDGKIESARTLLEKLRSDSTAIGRQVTSQALRLAGDWEGLLTWYRNLPQQTVLRDHALLPFYFRALGETKALDDLVLHFAARAQVLVEAPQNSAVLDFSLLVVLAFCGRTSALEKLFKRRLSKLPPSRKEFWIGTSELAAGAFLAGRTRLEEIIATSNDALLREESARRVQSARENYRALLDPWSEKVLQRIEEKGPAKHAPFLGQTVRLTPVVLALIILNAAMFLIEIALGGSTNELTLHRLGAMEPATVIYGGEYWRLLSGLFLHYGTLHLFFNLYALYLLGAPLENSLGALRFATCYLFAGIGSNIGVVILRFFGMTEADLLVGASGSIMGVVGAWAGLLLRHRHMPTAGQRLRSIIVIVAMQTAFDLATPQVSMGAHMGGLITGLIVGFVIAPRHGRGD